MKAGKTYVERKLDPACAAAKVVRAFNRELTAAHEEELVASLRASFEALRTGDMEELESMLMSQAKALEAIFVNLAVWAGSCSPKNQELMMRIAFRAQSQCRATLQALGQIGQNKLLELPDERMDGRAARSAIAASTAVETVVQFDRTKDCGREAKGFKKRLQGRAA